MFYFTFQDVHSNRLLETGIVLCSFFFFIPCNNYSEVDGIDVLHTVLHIALFFCALLFSL